MREFELTGGGRDAGLRGSDALDGLTRGDVLFLCWLCGDWECYHENPDIVPAGTRMGSERCAYDWMIANFAGRRSERAGRWILVSGWMPHSVRDDGKRIDGWRYTRRDGGFRERNWGGNRVESVYCRRFAIDGREALVYGGTDCSGKTGIADDGGDIRAGGAAGDGAIRGTNTVRRNLAMAELVEEAFSGHQHALVEAGTGTGKTLAYLIPAIRSGRRVVISTATKSLQEQLFFKDVPFIQKHFAPDLKVALMKGRSNFLCRQKVHLMEGQPVLKGIDEVDWFAQIRDWEKVTETGRPGGTEFSAGRCSAVGTDRRAARCLHRAEVRGISEPVLLPRCSSGRMKRTW